MNSSALPRCIVIWGPSAAGKTTLAQALAARLGWPYFDADDFHPEANIAKMARGEPLDDTDRVPWLDLLAARLKAERTAGRSCVLACSALAKRYRDRLGIDGEQVLGFGLVAPAGVLEQRARERNHQFMPASLVESQLAALEISDDDTTLDAAKPIALLCEEITRTLD